MLRGHCGTPPFPSRVRDAIQKPCWLQALVQHIPITAVVAVSFDSGSVMQHAYLPYKSLQKKSQELRTTHGSEGGCQNFQLVWTQQDRSTWRCSPPSSTLKLEIRGRPSNTTRCEQSGEWSHVNETLSSPGDMDMSSYLSPHCIRRFNGLALINLERISRSSLNRSFKYEYRNICA